MKIGNTIRIINPANTPCEKGDTGILVADVSGTNLQYGVRMADHTEWFAAGEIEAVDPVDAWMNGLCDDA